MQPERLQQVAVIAMFVFGVLALGASTGLTPIPKGNNAWALFLHPLVLVVGFGCGVATILRVRQIDDERWRLATDDDLTDGERQLAHSNANQEVKVAGTVFLLAALAIGGFFAYQFKLDIPSSLDEPLVQAETADEDDPGQTASNPSEPPLVTAAEFLIVTPMVGFVAGLWLGNKRFPAPEREW